MPTIFHSPALLGTAPRARPRHRLPMPLGGGSNNFLAEFASDFVDGDDGVGALVRVGSNNNSMVVTSIHCEVTVGPVGGHISVGRCHAPDKHVGLSFTPDADTTYGRQPEGTDATSRTPGDRIQPPQEAATSP